MWGYNYVPPMPCARIPRLTIWRCDLSSTRIGHLNSNPNNTGTDATPCTPRSHKGYGVHRLLAALSQSSFSKLKLGHVADSLIKMLLDFGLRAEAFCPVIASTTRLNLMGATSLSAFCEFTSALIC